MRKIARISRKLESELDRYWEDELGVEYKSDYRYVISNIVRILGGELDRGEVKVSNKHELSLSQHLMNLRVALHSKLIEIEKEYKERKEEKGYDSEGYEDLSDRIEHSIGLIDSESRHVSKLEEKLLRRDSRFLERGRDIIERKLRDEFHVKADMYK